MKQRVQHLRLASEHWSQSVSLAARCRRLGEVRHIIAQRLDDLVAATHSSIRVEDTETIAAELLPLCDALAELARRGPAVLAPRRHSGRGGPWWMWGVRSRVERVPWGVVGVLGTWNYPLLLAGVQVAQALAAGNAVLWKPAPGAEAATQCLAECFWAAGISEDLLQLAASDVASGQALIDAPVDHIVLTGSAATGRAVLRQAANWLTPATLELSGCDAAIVLPSADLDRLLDCLLFGLQTNSGATCIGPRRLIVTAPIADEVVRRLVARLRQVEPQAVHPAARGDLLDAVQTAIAAGAVDLLGHWDAAELSLRGQTRPLVLDQVRPDFEIASRDLFAPVLSLLRVSDAQGAITAANHCSYGLAASIFGDAAEAAAVASQLSVGTVTINDLIAPTADPRLPFGGTRESGFGVTRGPEGLLAMTRPRVISQRNAWFAPHLRPRTPQDRALLTAALQLKHLAGGKPRWQAFQRLLAAGRQRGASGSSRGDEKSEGGQRTT